MQNDLEKLPINHSLKEFIENLRNKYQVASVWVFGSYAAGTADSESDLDVGIVLSESVDFEKELSIFRLGQHINSKIESLTFSAEDFENPQFSIVSTILTQGIRVA